MKSQEVILLSDVDQTPTIAEPIRQLRTELIETATLVCAVTSPASRDSAVETLKKIKAFLKSVEDSRVDVKKPYLDACQAIDAQAKEFVAELTAEAKRINKLWEDYEAEQLRIQRAAELKRLNELQEIETRRREAEAEANRKAQLAEIERQKELLRIAEAEKAAKSKKERESLEAKRAEVEAKAAADAERHRLTQLSAEYAAAEAARQLQSKAVVEARGAGQKVKEEWDFEVTDIHALYRGHANLVQLQPLTQQIREVINHGTRQLHGVRIFERVKTSVRTTPGKVIEV